LEYGNYFIDAFLLMRGTYFAFPREILMEKKRDDDSDRKLPCVSQKIGRQLWSKHCLVYNFISSYLCAGC
jgi:hypothetical protein